MRRTLFILLALLGFSSGAIAFEDNRIADLYARGLRGDKQAVVDCIAALEARLLVEPNDQLARVYLGSAWTLRSRDLSLGFAKLSALRKGLALMDEAAAAAPGDARVLLQRAVTDEALPAILGRRQMARAELDKLVAQVDEEPARLDPFDRQLLYLNAGMAAERAGEKSRAIELWQRGAAIKANDNLTNEIRRALDRS